MIPESNLPEQSNEDVKEIAGYIKWYVEDREERPLHNALTARLGATVGIFLEHLVFWSGKSSHCENGWFYKNRDEIQYTTGLDRRDQDFARKVLRGEREWKRRTVKLLYEHRPSRRKATHFRVDLIAMAELLDVTLPDELLPDELDIMFPEEEEETPETPYRATHESARDTSESPYRAAESPCRATETPYRAPESLNRAASASTTASPSSSSFSYSLHSSGENGLNGHPSPPQINKDLEPEEQDSPQPIDDKRHSQDSDTPGESTSATEQLSSAEMKDRRFIRAALADPEACGLEEPLRQYRAGEIDLPTLANTMRRKRYLRGCNAYSSLRPQQLAAVLDEMREEVAA